MKLVIASSANALEKAQKLFGLPETTNLIGSEANHSAIYANVISPAELASVLQQHAELEVLYVFNSPELFLGQLLRDGHSVEQAMNQWSQVTNQLIFAHKGNRRRVKLLNIDTELQHLDVLPDWTAAQPCSTPCISQLFELLSWYLLRTDPKLSAQLVLLEASSLALSEHFYPPFDLNALHTLAKKSECYDKDQTCLQRELNALQAKLNEEKQQLDASKAELADSQQKYEADCSNLKAENELLLLQLMNVQEELEKTYLAKQKAQQDIDSSQVELNKLKSQLEAGAAELEANKKKAQSQLADSQQKYEADCGNLKAENELLLLQLMNVQEELEAYYIKNKALEKQSEELQKGKNGQPKGEGKAKVTKLPAYKGPLVNRMGDVFSIKMRDIALIATSEFFDFEWYLQTYPDIANSKMSPAKHYLLYGAKEGRMPGPKFDGNWYLQRYPDVAQKGMNPLLHYIRHGQNEGRSVSPLMLMHRKSW